MRISKILVTIFIGLSFLLAGCQTTIGLASAPPDSPPAIPRNTFILVHGPDDGANDNEVWRNTFTEFVPEDHIYTHPKLVDDPNAHLIIARIQVVFPVYANLDAVAAGLTLFIIPGCDYIKYSADFEAYQLASEASNPTKLHYEFSNIECFWLPVSLVKKTSGSVLVRKLYRQYFSDYAKLLNNPKVVEVKDE